MIAGKLEVAIGITFAVFNAFHTDKTKLRYFLGTLNVCRRFMNGFEKRKSPLNAMLWNGAEKDWTIHVRRKWSHYKTFETH